MIDGSQVGGGRFEDGEYDAMLQRIDKAGWQSAGSFDNEIGGVNAGFWRQEDKLAGGKVEAIERLALLDEQGTLLPGFTVEVDEETDAVVIGYEGRRDDKFDKLIDELVAWGEELEARQTEALADEQKVAWAKDVGGRLTRQLTRLEGESFVDRIAAEDRRPREAVIASVVSIAIPGFINDLEPAAAVEFLETLFAQTVAQQNQLRDRDASPEVKAEFDMFSGIARGVQRELRLRRDIQALEGESSVEIVEVDEIKAAYEAAQADPRVRQLLEDAKAEGERVQAEGRDRTGLNE
jgi:hypothetical protein